MIIKTFNLGLFLVALGMGATALACSNPNSADGKATKVKQYLVFSLNDNQPSCINAPQPVAITIIHEGSAKNYHSYFELEKNSYWGKITNTSHEPFDSKEPKATRHYTDILVSKDGHETLELKGICKNSHSHYVNTGTWMNEKTGCQGTFEDKALS